MENGVIFKVVTSSHVAHACFATLHSWRSWANYRLSGSMFDGFLASSCRRVLSQPSTTFFLLSVLPFALVFGVASAHHRGTIQYACTPTIKWTPDNFTSIGGYFTSPWRIISGKLKVVCWAYACSMQMPYYSLKLCRINILWFFLLLLRFHRKKKYFQSLVIFCYAKLSQLWSSQQNPQKFSILRLYGSPQHTKCMLVQ